MGTNSYPRYTYAVVVNTNDDWQRWVAEKVYGNKPYLVNTDNFILRDIRYTKISMEKDIRGCIYDGVIIHQNAIYNDEYITIMESISHCLT